MVGAPLHIFIALLCVLGLMASILNMDNAKKDNDDTLYAFHIILAVINVICIIINCVQALDALANL